MSGNISAGAVCERLGVRGVFPWELFGCDGGTPSGEGLVMRDSSLGETMYRPTFFGTGGISSPMEEIEDRVEGVRGSLKKPDDAKSDEPGDEERVAVPGRWPDILARLLIVFPVEGRPTAPVLVLGREDPDKAFEGGDRFGRTPDKDARDCMNFRRSTPFSLTSWPCPSLLVISMVVRAGAGDMYCGRAGTGGGAGSCWYFSRRPPVLMRFTSFHHLPPGDISSSRSLPLILDERDMPPSSCGEGLPLVAGLGEPLGLFLPSIDMSRGKGLR